MEFTRMLNGGTPYQHRSLARAASGRLPPRPLAALRTASSMVERMHGDDFDEREKSFASNSIITPR